MKAEEHKFLWEMREFAKAHAGKLISREFLGRTHPYKWRYSEKHVFYSVFWELKEQNIFVRGAKSKILLNLLFVLIFYFSYFYIGTMHRHVCYTNGDMGDYLMPC